MKIKVVVIGTMIAVALAPIMLSPALAVKERPVQTVAVRKNSVVAHQPK
ncbi:MAG: hypothetical protein ACJ72F_04990 [Nitrososphaeraceae archaeon]